MPYSKFVKNFPEDLIHTDTQIVLRFPSCSTIVLQDLWYNFTTKFKNQLTTPPRSTIVPHLDSDLILKSHPPYQKFLLMILILYLNQSSLLNKEHNHCAILHQSYINRVTSVKILIGNLQKIPIFHQIPYMQKSQCLSGLNFSMPYSKIEFHLKSKSNTIFPKLIKIHNKTYL